MRQALRKTNAKPAFISHEDSMSLPLRLRQGPCSLSHSSSPKDSDTESFFRNSQHLFDSKPDPTDLKLITDFIPIV